MEKICTNLSIKKHLFFSLIRFPFVSGVHAKVVVAGGCMIILYKRSRAALCQTQAFSASSTMETLQAIAAEFVVPL